MKKSSRKLNNKNNTEAQSLKILAQIEAEMAETYGVNWQDDLSLLELSESMMVSLC